MATFVSLATCHHCNLTSRRGLVYRDSLSALSRNLRAPGFPHHHAPRVPGLPLAAHRLALQTKRHSRPPSSHRSDPPESIALAHSKPAGSMKRLVFAHLRKLLTLSPTQRRREPDLNLLV